MAERKARLSQPKDHSGPSEHSGPSCHSVQPGWTPGLQPVAASLAGAELASLKEALLRELDPQGAFQHSLALNIVENEIDIRVLRARRDMLFWGEAAQVMVRYLTPALTPQAARALAHEWAAQKPEAGVEIAARGIDPELVLNAAFVELLQITGLINQQIERFERRRRLLREEYRGLKSARPVAQEIEEAELVAE